MCGPDAARREPRRDQWRIRGGVILLDRPRVMGIINVTPDSFSDGGAFASVAAAVEHGHKLLDEGADILDVGGESTRPQGATPVDVTEEMRRVMPVVEGLLAAHPRATISVDTTKADVAAAALAAGAAIINDVSGFRFDAVMGSVCAEAGAGVILMHSRGTLSDMASYQHAIYSDDVVGDILVELTARIEAAQRAGVGREAIAVDPGFGFSKRTEHSVAVLRDLERVRAIGYPVVVGVSRKRFVGELSGVGAATARGHGSIAANVIALMRGARVFRVHDVAATRQALAVAWGALTPSQ
jgi:dihydropteroate synthase